MTEGLADKGGSGGGDHIEDGRDAGDRKGERKIVVALLARGSCECCKFDREKEPLNDL